MRMNGYSLKTPEETAADLMVRFVTEKRFKGDAGAKEIGKVIGEYLVLLD